MARGVRQGRPGAPLWALVVLAGLSLPFAGQAQAQSAETVTPFPVSTVTVETTTHAQEYQLTGTIAALDSYSAGFRDGGRVISVNADVGDVVRAGDEIAAVDPTQAQAGFNSAQASLDAANAALVQAQQARDRAASLLERGSGTQADLDSATESFLTAQASRDQAKARLEAARQTLEDTVLTVLRDGIITERTAEPGQVVGAGQPIGTLASLDGREAVFYVPNVKDLMNVKGEDVTLTPLEGGEALTVQVTEVSPVVAPNGTVTVKAEIPAGQGRLYTIGEAVVGRIVLEQPPGITIPWQALNADARGPAVWVLDPASNRVALRPITVDEYHSKTVDVAEGLEDGDIIVTGGSHALYPDRLVAVKEAP